jgi:hypothetical protein
MENSGKRPPRREDDSHSDFHKKYYEQDSQPAKKSTRRATKWSKQPEESQPAAQIAPKSYLGAALKTVGRPRGSRQPSRPPSGSPSSSDPSYSSSGSPSESSSDDTHCDPVELEWLRGLRSKFRLLYSELFVLFQRDLYGNCIVIYGVGMF